MFGLKSVYLYLIACQITLIKFFKKIYFSSRNYNKSLETKTPQQVYYNPNPFLLSIITSYNDQSFKISEIDPNVFWLEEKKDVQSMVNFCISNLEKKNFFKPIEKKPIMLENLRSIFYKMELSEKETRILSSVFANLAKKG